MEKGESEGTLSEPPPFVHQLDYVISTWMQHKIHHTYPRAGGYDDQDEYLMKDWQSMNMFYMRAQAGVFMVVMMDTPLMGWSKEAGE